MSNKNQTVTIRTEPQLDAHLAAQKRSQAKGPASRSHVEDALSGHSKSDQRPVVPAHSSVRDNVNIDESRDQTAKKKAEPAFVGAQSESRERDALGEKQLNRFDRSYPGDAKESKGAAARARQAGPHGKVVHSDGSNQATKTNPLVRT